jgi:hypothetical protein
MVADTVSKQKLCADISSNNKLSIDATFLSPLSESKMKKKESFLNSPPPGKIIRPPSLIQRKSKVKAWIKKKKYPLERSKAAFHIHTITG